MMASDRRDLRRPIGLTMSQACPEITKPRLMREESRRRLQVAAALGAGVALVIVGAVL